MIFIESQIFTKNIARYLSDTEYAELQSFLIENPDSGDIIQGTGGLRKLRWGIDNRGKRGGVRIIYYYKVSHDQIYMMTLYAKNEMKDLSEKEKKILGQLLERW